MTAIRIPATLADADARHLRTIAPELAVEPVGSIEAMAARLTSDPRATAIIIGPGASPVQVASLTRRFPAVSMFGAVVGPQVQQAFEYGRAGCRAVFDVSTPRGVRDLAASVGQARRFDTTAEIRRAMVGALPADAHDARRFVDAVTEWPATARQLCRKLGVCPSTLMSKFFRARLPSPKQWVAEARLALAVEVYERTRCVRAVADELEYSSPQSLGRHLRTWRGKTASVYFQTMTPALAVRAFREWAEPHLPTLAHLDLSLKS